MITLPPLLKGALNATEIEALPCVSVGWAGAPGMVAGTVDADATDGLPAPFAFEANTVQVYVLPLVNAGTTTGEVAPEFDPDVPPSLDVQVAV